MIWIATILLTGIVLWIMLAPLRLEINTRKDIYRLDWRGIGSACLQAGTGFEILEIRILFWKKRIPVSGFGVRGENKKTPAHTPQKAPAGRAKGFAEGSGWKTGKRILKTFKVRYCRLWLDTGDFLWNAWLFPLSRFLNKPDVAVRINFQGINELSLLVENRLGRILWALISSRFQHQ